MFFDKLERVILVTGHYGSGKTNFAVNLALDLQKAGRRVAVCDLDIVNPYFRTADFTALLQQRGIETIMPPFANTNLDIPVLGAGVSAALGDREKTVIVDVGGDDAGAIALGRYAPEIAKRPYSMLYVHNHYRFLENGAEETKEILDGINGAARLTCGFLVNNSNLGEETSAAVIQRALGPAWELSALCALPLLCTTAPRSLCGELQSVEDIYPIDLYVDKPWNRQHL